MPPTATPFSATTFLRGMSPRPTTLAAANSALAAALESTKTAEAATKESVRVAALAWEHERTTADALARQVAEAERFLHASAGERVTSSQQPSPTALPTPSVGPPSGTDDPMVTYLHLQVVGVPHIKNLVTVLDCTSTFTSYARWRDQVLLMLRRYALNGHVLSNTHARCSRPGVAMPRQHHHVRDLWDHLPTSPGHLHQGSSLLDLLGEAVQLAYLGISRLVLLISSHRILFILPTEHYSFYQPNTEFLSSLNVAG
jgi:hypothetical protein